MKAKIEVLSKTVDGVEKDLFPLTVIEGVVDPETKKNAKGLFEEKADHGYEENPKTLKEVDDEKALHGYSEEEEPKTLKQVDDAKLDKSSVKQVLGASTTDVMSQKAVTDELAKKHQVVVDYTHTSNKEVNIESIDFATGTITATGHGLAVNDIAYLINKEMGNFPFSALPNGINPLTAYFVVNVTPNTFQLSLSGGGAPITISDKATRDYSKWHFELPGNTNISGLSLRKFTVEFEGKSSGHQAINDYFYLYGGKNYGVASPVWFTDTEYGKITSGLSRSIFKSMANGDIWSYNRLDVDVTGKRASILINGYRIYSLTETTSGIIRHNNEVAVHSSVGEDVVTRLYQSTIFNGMNIKVTKIL